jgi:hypothetical protein
MWKFCCKCRLNLSWDEFCVCLISHTNDIFFSIYKMAAVCRSTTLCAPDSVRIPTSVNAVAEYISQTMDYLREKTSNAMAGTLVVCNLFQKSGSWQG